MDVLQYFAYLRMCSHSGLASCVAKNSSSTRQNRVMTSIFSKFFRHFLVLKSLFSTKNIANFELIFVAHFSFILNYESSKEFLKKISIFASKHPTVLEQPYWWD